MEVFKISESFETNYDKTIDYKNKIISLFLSNKNLIKLISPSEFLDMTEDEININFEDVLLGDGNPNTENYGYIFDYNYVDDSIKDDKAFIMVDVTIDKVKDQMLADFGLHVWICCSKKTVRIDNYSIPTLEEIESSLNIDLGHHGNRVDLICKIIDNILCNANDFKGATRVVPYKSQHALLYSPNTKFYGKKLTYSITNCLKQ